MTTSVVCLPDGIELAFEEGEDGLRLQSYAVPTTGSPFLRVLHREPNQAFRSKRFATVAELVEAVRRELASAPNVYRPAAKAT